MKGTLFSLCLLLALTGCSRPEESVRLAGVTMGTTWSLVLTETQDRDLTLLHTGIMQVLAEVNSAMSTWDPDSEISRFNQMAAGCVDISPAFAEVMGAALEISALTQGAYDVSLGPVIDLWGFGAAEGVSAPDAGLIAATLARSGYQHLELTGARLCKDRDDLQINLSSIAKGYGVDAVANYLRAEGLDNFLIEIGGELLAQGDKFGEPWRVGVENPAAGNLPSATLTLPLVDQAVATSGDYRNFFILDGRRYSHIIDARTGQPADNAIASASVVAEDVTMADGWATALMILDPASGLALADTQGLAVLLILRDPADESNFHDLTNARWQALFGD